MEGFTHSSKDYVSLPSCLLISWTFASNHQTLSPEHPFVSCPKSNPSFSPALLSTLQPSFGPSSKALGHLGIRVCLVPAGAVAWLFGSPSPKKSGAMGSSNSSELGVKRSHPERSLNYVIPFPAFVMTLRKFFRRMDARQPLCG